jgi:hypothetical protein
MKAIITKYIGPTSTQPSRIKAYDADGNRIIVSYEKLSENAKHIDDVHRNAAVALCEKMKWDPTHLVTGWMGGTLGYVHVWDDEGQRAATMKEIVKLLTDPDEKKTALALDLAKANAPKR